MRRIFFASVALATVASAACRQYDVDVYRNVNGKVRGADGVTESFTCTADSLLWAEAFIGEANSPGAQYEFEVRRPGSATALYTGTGQAGSSIHYQYVRAALSRNQSAPELIKGETYDLKVTLSSPSQYDSINWYADSTDPYRYGIFLNAPLQGQSEPLTWDLAARIEGVNRPVSREFFGMNGMECRWDSTDVDHHYALMDTLGIGLVREDIYWHELESIPGNFRWWIFDPIAIAAARHHMSLQVILQSCPRWASTHIDTIENGNDTVWDRDCPPQGLAEPVKSADSVNRNNCYAYYVYRVVKRYKPGSAFWDSVGVGNDNFGVSCYEVFNEPNYWRNPDPRVQGTHYLTRSGSVMQLID